MTQHSEQSSAVWLTQKTFDRLTAELEELRGPRRAEVIARISAAREEGDLKENGGYHAAKDEQGQIEARIRQLEEMLDVASTEPAADEGVVAPGTVVSYRFAGEEADSFLLGARDIAEDHDDVEVYSPQSPLGNALLGASRGDIVNFATPTGKTVKVEVLDAVPYTG